MARFIPEWKGVSLRDARLYRHFALLDDDYVLRKRIRSTESPQSQNGVEAASLSVYIQHPIQGWGLFVVCDIPFEKIDPAQADLFESPERKSFNMLLAKLSSLEGIASIGKAVLLRGYSKGEADRLKERYGGGGVGFLADEELGISCENAVSGHLKSLGKEQSQNLLASLFPETELKDVPLFQRDVSARNTRYFLDIDQEWAAKLDLDLPDEQLAAVDNLSLRLLNGVAGSGKTLIAITRARLLAERFPNQKVLFLSHNRPLVSDVALRLNRGGSLPNLETKTFYSWAMFQSHCLFDKWPSIVEPSDVVVHIQDLRKQSTDLSVSDDYVRQELDFINDSLVADESQYLEMKRLGRDVRLGSEERSRIWAIFEDVAKRFKTRKRQLWSDVPRQLCMAEKDHEKLEKYHHILIDETQFFAASWLRLVQLSRHARGSLFLCADPQQGFLKSRLSWKSIGFDVRGRTKTLKKSYRTTRQILEAATAILAAGTHCEESEREEFLQPEFREMREGPRPLLLRISSPLDALDRVENEIIASIAQGGLSLSNILVVYGRKIDTKTVIGRMSRRFGFSKVWNMNPPRRRSAKIDPSFPDRLRLVQLETATGLEATVVYLVGMENLFWESMLPSLHEEEKKENREGNMRRLYMAMTRAAQRLVLITSENLPPSVLPYFEVPEPSSPTSVQS